MNYFKADLLARCRSRDDEDADTAAEEWERAIAAYRSRLRAVRRLLPAGARRLLSRVTLHDAKVLAVAFARKSPSFTLMIQLEGTSSQPGDVLELRYLLVTGPHGGVSVSKHLEFNKGAPGLGWILYDEFDLDAGQQRPFFTHSLLLTGGQEVEVRFHNLQVRHLDEVLLPPRELPEGERTWPMVEA